MANTLLLCCLCFFLVAPRLVARFTGRSAGEILDRQVYLLGWVAFLLTAFLGVCRAFGG